MLPVTLSHPAATRCVHRSVVPSTHTRQLGLHLHKRSRRSQRIVLAQDEKTSAPTSLTTARKEEDEEIVGLGLGPMKEKSTLISDNWVGDQYQGSGVNILTVILGLTFAVPVIGLGIAYLSYGSLWTGQWGVIPY